MALLTLLSTYVIRLREKQKNTQLILSDFDTKGSDFLTLFQEFLNYRVGNHYKGSKDADGFRKSLYYKTGDIDQIDNRTIQGYIYSGLAGQKGDVVDDETGEDLYEMQENHAKILPTYFFLHIPKNRRDGYLILQRRSTYGVKGLLESAFYDFLKNTGSNLKLEINSFLVSLVFEKMLKVGRIYEMSFIRNQIPDNIEDIYDRNSQNKRIKGKTKTTITTTHEFPVKGLLSRMYHGELKDGMVEIPELHERYDEVDFEMDYNGSKKTFHMKNVGRTSPDFNVSEHVVYDERNLPTYESMHKQCRILLKDMKEYHEAKLK